MVLVRHMRDHELAKKGNPASDVTREKVMAWCADDQSLRAEAVSADPESRFSIRVNTGAGELQINYPKRGVERVVLERKTALTAEQQKMLAEAGVEKEEDMNRMLRGLLASRSSLISCSFERNGERATISTSYPVYLDGLTRHSFLSALTDIDRFTTIVDLTLRNIASAARVRRATEEAINKTQAELEKSVVPTVEQLPAREPERRPATARRARPVRRPKARTCRKCGAAVPKGDRFCRNCGTPAY